MNCDVSYVVRALKVCSSMLPAYLTNFLNSYVRQCTVRVVVFWCVAAVVCGVGRQVEGSWSLTSHLEQLVLGYAVVAAAVVAVAAAAVAAEVEARERKSLGSIGGGADK